MVKYSSTSRKVFMVINYCILALLSLTCLLPFVHLLAVSFSSSAAVSAGEVGFWPVDFTLFSYEFALKGGKFFAALLVSLERVVLGVCINLALMIVTAYPLSKAKEKVAGRNIYMAFFVITMLINGGGEAWPQEQYLVSDPAGSAAGLQYDNSYEFYAGASGGN